MILTLCSLTSDNIYCRSENKELNTPTHYIYTTYPTASTAAGWDFYFDLNSNGTTAGTDGVKTAVNKDIRGVAKTPVRPNGGIVGPNGGAVGFNGGVVGPNGGVVSPNGKIVGPNGGVVGPDGRTVGPDRRISKT